MRNETTAEPAGNAEKATHVLSLLEQQMSLFARLEALSCRQRTLVTMEDTGPLLSLLAQRQKLSVTLAEVGGQLDPMRRRWEEVRAQMDVEQRGRADRLVAESAASLKRIMETDEQDARMLSARKQMVSHSLRGAHETSCAVSAYREAGAASATAGRVDEAS